MKKKITFYIGKIDLGTYKCIEGDIKVTAEHNGILMYTNVDIVTNFNTVKLAA